MKIPVLTYHATNISGNSYHNNDLVAFNQDLQQIYKLGIKILSACDLVKWVKGDLILDDSQTYVVLTFDDGSELDFYDWQHPVYGQQQSFYSTLKTYKAYNIHATSFVIASPEARSVLVDTCTAGHNIWGDDWWKMAEQSGLLSIENHSWDHLHATLDDVAQENNEKGDFTKITTLEDAHSQIQDATEYIQSKINKKVSLFAYPYGHYNQYLIDDYLPNQQSNIEAAFTCEPKPVTQETNIWKIPRYVCGLDWKTNAELNAILLVQ